MARLEASYPASKEILTEGAGGGAEDGMVDFDQFKPLIQTNY